MMPLALPSFDCTLKQQAGKTYILDLIRKKYLQLTPEEWVRQHMLHYLIHHLKYPRGLCRSEQKIWGVERCFRPDILLCDARGISKLLIECKSPHQLLTQDALGQLMHYNRYLSVNVLVLTNGQAHFCWQSDPNTGTFNPIPHIPTYEEFVKFP